MTTDIAPSPNAGADVADVDVRVDRPPSAAGRQVAAIGAWVTSSDSKVIGRSFIGVSALVLLACSAMAALLGAERIDGDEALLDAGSLPQLFTGYRFGLTYGVMVPLLLGIAVAIVPLQVGARSLAFPRLAAAGFWTWLSGIVLIVIALANNGGPGGGNLQMVELFLGAHILTVLGLAAAACSVATTVLTTRAPGMRMSRVPLFSWSALVASIGLLLALPVVIGVTIYVYVDLRYSQALFGGSLGVDSWIEFAVTQPTTYLYAVPAVGLAAELVALTFRTRFPMRGVALTGIGLVGVAALAAVTQQAGFDLPWSGEALNLGGFSEKVGDLLPYALFMLLPLLGVVVVMGIGALAGKPAPGRPRPRLTAAFVFAFFGLGMVFVGMLGGALYPIVDLGLQGTVFEEAVFVYVAYGIVLAGIGAVLYWTPKWTGRLVPERAALGLAPLGLLATILASFPYYIAGFADQPARSGGHGYDGPAELWNVAVTIGHALMLLVVLAFVGLWLRSARHGEPAGDDPWGGQTLEWATTSPAPDANFAETPTVMSPEPILDLRAAPPGVDR